jgi:large subunit ribosomal protein L13
MHTQKCFQLKPRDHKKQWMIIDATDKIVGRLASEVARVLKGKNNPAYTPNVDCGHPVIIINAEKVKFTGNKWKDKIYHHHTGYTGGIKSRTATEQLEKQPAKILEIAIKGMLSKNSLGREQFRNLKVIVGSEHSYQAQKPQTLNFPSLD